MEKEEIEKLKQTGKIASQVVEFAKSIIKKDMLLVEIANKIESKIEELGAKPAFPVSLAINEIAAHSTPEYNDETKASGLLKIDIGCHIDGYVADTAFSLDLEDNQENRELIQAAESALKKGIEIISTNSTLAEVGKEIEEEIKSRGFTSIRNLSGHSLGKFELHSGITIPNFDNSSDLELDEGAYAIEPFATNGSGVVRDGKPSGIYRLEKEGNFRDSLARQVLQFIKDNYNTLPFCSRWIHKKFNSRGLLSLRQIEAQGILHHYPQLIEKDLGKVAQAEHTIILTNKEKIITTNL